MIAGLFNLVVTLLLAGGVAFILLKYAIPYSRKLKEEEERVRRHEAWINEQSLKEANLAESARKEVEAEFGPIDTSVGGPIQKDENS